MLRIPVDPEGRISLPQDVSDQFDIKPGDILEVEVEDDHLIVRKAKRLPLSAFLGRFEVDHPPDLSWSEMRDIAWREQTKRLLPPEMRHVHADDTSPMKQDLDEEDDVVR